MGAVRQPVGEAEETFQGRDDRRHSERLTLSG